jgi:hypothetical protein
VGADEVLGHFEERFRGLAWKRKTCVPRRNAA